MFNKIKKYVFNYISGKKEMGMPVPKEKKVTIPKLRKDLEKILIPLGYISLPSKTHKFYLVKHLDNGCYLAIGSTFSRYNSSMFALDFYFSMFPSGFVTNGMVCCIRSRVERFLTIDEQKELISYPNVEYYKTDWLYKDDPEVVSKIYRIIELSENKFISHIHIEQVFQDELFKSLCEMYFTIIDIVKNQDLSDKQLSYIKIKKDNYNVGMEWYKATEIYLEKEIKRMQQQVLIEIAIESYRIHHCEQLYGRSKYVQAILDELGMNNI